MASNQTFDEFMDRLETPGQSGADFSLGASSSRFEQLSAERNVRAEVGRQTESLVSQNVLPPLEIALFQPLAVTATMAALSAVSGDGPPDVAPEPRQPGQPPREGRDRGAEAPSTGAPAVRAEIKEVVDTVVGVLRNSNGMLDRDQLNTLDAALRGPLAAARESEFGLSKLWRIRSDVYMALSRDGGPSSRGERIQDYEMNFKEDKDGSMSLELTRNIAPRFQYGPNEGGNIQYYLPRIPQRIHTIRSAW